MEGSGRCLIDLCVQTKSSILLETVFFPSPSILFFSFIIRIILGVFFFNGRGFDRAATHTKMTIAGWAIIF